MFNEGISVITCCYNSSIRIKDTLKHLANQQFTYNINWEIIVVDNASTDNTFEIAKTEWNILNQSVPLIIVSEPDQGIIYARKKGISVSNYSYIVFCDDDNWLNPDYLQIAYDLLKKYPDAGAIGGQGQLVTDGNLPDWWADWQNSYGIGKQTVNSGDISDKGYLWGAGLISRKTLLIKVFNPDYPFLLTGRKGHLITSGDDAEICYRMILLGWKLYYNEQLIFKHFIPKSRLTDNYLKELNRGFESTHSIQEKYLSAIKYKQFNSFMKFTYLLKRVSSVIFSKFKSRKIELLKIFLLFALGINLSKDEDLSKIYSFVKQK